MIDFQKPEQMYLQLYNEIAAKIKDGIYEPNKKLPSERDLCDIYKVSRITVRQALDMLSRDGLVFRRQGMGTFVMSKPIEHKLSRLYTLREELMQKGVNYRSELLVFAKTDSLGEIANKLSIGDDESIYKIVRLLYADGTPFTVETSYLPASIFINGLTKEQIEKRGLYNSLQENGIVPTNATESMKISYADKNTAKLIQTKNSEPCMFIQRITYCNDKIIEYTTNTIRGDFFEYTIELS